MERLEYVMAQVLLVLAFAAMAWFGYSLISIGL